MTHDYKYENLREEDRNALIPAIKSAPAGRLYRVIADGRKFRCFATSEAEAKEKILGAETFFKRNALPPANVTVEIWQPEEETEQDGDGGCRPRGVDSRDPAYDTTHDWKYLGEAGGTSFYQCRKCGASDEGPYSLSRSYAGRETTQSR